MFHPREIGEWLDTRFNRTRGAFDPAAFWSLYESSPGRALEAAPPELTEGQPAELLVVITTYRRPDACAHLLYALAQAVDEAQRAPTTRVLVLNDRGDADYRATRTLARALFGTELIWLDAREHLGKPGFWRAYQTAFLAALVLAPAHTLFLQDDLEFAPNMLTEAFALWQAADDPLRRVLYLFSSDTDERWGRWIWFRRRELGDGLRLTQWFDLQAFLVDRAFFELLAYRMVPIHRNRWRRFSWLSSGVGHQLTIRLRRRANVYQVFPPLVFHGGQGSEMNPGARAWRALDNRRLARKRA